MEEYYKFVLRFTIILCLSLSFLVNSVLVVAKYTRRNAEEFSRIQTINIEKVKYAIDSCIKSGGIVDDVNWDADITVNCKEKIKVVK